MKNIIILILSALQLISAETLFEVKDASNNKVLDVSTDGLRVMNLGDTLMVISTNEIKAVLDNSKGLSRSFSVTTSSSKGSGSDLMRLTGDSTRFWISDTGSGFGVASNSRLKTINTNVFEVTTSDARLREGAAGEEYMNFSPLNIFLGLNAGTSVGVGRYNVLIGNDAGNGMVGVNDPSYRGWSNTFIGDGAGKYATNSSHNTYIGKESGASNSDGGDNTFVGTYCGQTNNGSCNSFFGNFSGGNGTGTGSFNTFAGYLSGAYITSGNSNLMLGDRAGYNIRGGSNNVQLGYRAGYQNQSGTGNVLIGFEAGFNETGSNKLYIANSNTASPLISGTFPNTNLTFTAGSVTVAHPSGISNGLYIKNADYSNNWHFYQYSTGGLYLFYNGIQRGTWNSTTGVYTPYSKEVKNSVEDLSSVLEKVMKLQPKKYNVSGQKEGDQKQIGMIAQDVKELFPEFVYFNEEDQTYSLDYAGLSVVALQAVKEQQEIINKLVKRIDDLESKK